MASTPSLIRARCVIIARVTSSSEQAEGLSVHYSGLPIEGGRCDIATDGLPFFHHGFFHSGSDVNRVNLLGCTVVPNGPLSGAAMSVLITSQGILSPSLVSESVVDIPLRVNNFISQRTGSCCREFGLSDLST